MNERIMIRGGPMPEGDPLPLRQAAGAALDSLKLAWEADRNGLLLLIAVQTASTAADIAQLFVSRSAVDGVVEGDRRGVQARRLVILGGLGVVRALGRSGRGLWGNPVGQATVRRA